MHWRNAIDFGTVTVSLFPGLAGYVCNQIKFKELAEEDRYKTMEEEVLCAV